MCSTIGPTPVDGQFNACRIALFLRGKRVFVAARSGRCRGTGNFSLSEPNQPSVNPFELHGLACGLLCGAGATADTARAELLCELIGIERRTPELARSMAGVLQDCQVQMARGEHDFEPMLPGEDAPLSIRTAALARWCEGFLAGVGACGTPPQGTAADREETLRDLSAIAQADEGGDLGEEEEWHFFEIKEYVRMAAISFFLDAHAEPPPTAPDTVH